MVNEQSRGVAVARIAKKPLVLFLIAAALLAVLAVSERSGGSSLNGTDIASRRGSARQNFSSLFGSQAGPARAVQVPSSGGPAVAGATTADQALATAQNVAGQAVGQASAAAGAAVAAEHWPPFVTAIVCPILLQARATVVTVINGLIAAFPFLAPQLNAVRASALATIDALLASFHCTIPS